MGDLRKDLAARRLAELRPDNGDALPDLTGVPTTPPEKRIDFDNIRCDLNNHVEEIARHYFPNGKKIRKHWCTGDINDTPPVTGNGSFVLDLAGSKIGRYQEFNGVDGGGLLDLIMYRENLDIKQTVEFCRSRGWLGEHGQSRPAPPVHSTDTEEKRARARAIWQQSVSVEGTPAEAYLNSRGLPPPYSSSLRFHESANSGHPSLVVAFGDPTSDDIRAIQVTALMPDGSGKASITAPRRTFGSPEGFGVVVQPRPGATDIVVAEGVETALSLCGGFPDAEIVAFGPKNNLLRVRIDTRFERVTIAADQDAKDDADTLADRLRRDGKQVRVALPARSGAEVAKGYDFNDLLREKGAEAVKEQLNLSTFSAAASALAAPKLQRGRFEARPFSEIPDSATGKFLVEGLLPANGLFCLFGAPGTGKSFVTHDLAIAVASGQDFAGRNCQQGLVVSLAGEGEFGLKQRLQAAAEQRGCPSALEKVWSIPGPFDMAQDGGDLNKSLLEIQERAGEPIRLVIIDTLSQTFGVGDQDKARDMQAWLNGVSMVTSGLPEVLVGTVHHAGWTEDRERGSTALRGAVDLMIKLTRDESRLTLKPVKNLRDGEPWEPFSLELVETYLPSGQSTLTIGHAMGSSTSRPGPTGLGKRKSQILAALSKRPMTLIELTEAMPSSSQASNLKTLNAMRDRQLVEKEGDLYRLKE